MEQTEDIGPLQAHIFDIAGFLVDKFHHLEVSFPHRIGLFKSYNSLRELHLGKYLELLVDIPSKWNHALEFVNGFKLPGFPSVYKCCKLNGTFTVTEFAISVKMEKDSLANCNSNIMEVLTSNDVSSPMHLQEIANRHIIGSKIIRVANNVNGEQL